MPAHAGLRRRRPLAARSLAAVACTGVTLGLAACGALPPQAPVHQASAISSALATIAASCGESYRLQAFTARPDLSGLDATAAHSAATLARIAGPHPGWIYQDRTLTQLDALSATALRSCSLTRAAGLLGAARTR